MCLKCVVTDRIFHLPTFKRTAPKIPLTAETAPKGFCSENPQLTLRISQLEAP